MNGTLRGLLLAIVMLGCLLGAIPVRAQGELPWVWFWDSPMIAPNHKVGEPYAVAPRTEYFTVGCYDASSGRKLNCEVLWQEAFSVTGVSPEALPLWKGGHEHDRMSGDFDRTIGLLSCEVDPNAGTDLARFHGFTLSKYWNGLKAMPEASGVIRVGPGDLSPAVAVCPEFPLEVRPYGAQREAQLQRNSVLGARRGIGRIARKRRPL